MLGKVIKPGSGFKGKINYLFEGKLNTPNYEKYAKIIIHSDNLIVPLDKNDLEQRKEMINMFIDQAKLHDGYKDRKTDYIGEHVLSFSKSDLNKLSENDIQDICRQYVSDAGLDNTQYTAISHNDTNQFHVHILFNRVNNDGKLYDKWKEKQKTMERSVALCLKYDLEIPEKLQNLTKSHNVYEIRLKHDDIKNIISEGKLDDFRNLNHMKNVCEKNGTNFFQNGNEVHYNHKRYKLSDLETVFYKNRKPKISSPNKSGFEKGKKTKKIYPIKEFSKKSYEIKKEIQKQKMDVFEELKELTTHEHHIPDQQVQEQNYQLGRKIFGQDEDDLNRKRKKRRR